MIASLMYNLSDTAKSLLLSGILCLLLLTSALSQAQREDSSTCDSGEQGCVPIGKWQVSLGLGFGVRDNPLIDGEETPLFLIPHVQYYGERFFIDTYVGGFTLVETERSMINAILTISFDQIYFRTDNIGNFALESGPLAYEARNDDESRVESSNDALIDEEFINSDGFAYDRDADEIIEPSEIIVTERLHSRDTAIMGGIELAYFFGGWDFSLQLLKDISGVNNGNESRLSTSRYFMFGRNHFEFASGITWQDQKTMDYYWGILETEVENPALSYRASGGFSPFVRIDWHRKLFDNWSLQTTFHHKWLSNEISASPLVEEDTVLTVFIGGVYHF